jgi:hypothetical protein
VDNTTNLTLNKRKILKKKKNKGKTKRNEKKWGGI